MAVIQTGALISNISGSIGGTTFQRNGHGLCVKNKTSPVNFNSSSQVARRNLIATLQHSWQALSVNQRSAWQHWATFQGLKSGKYSKVSMYGQEAFIQANFYAQLVGLAILSDPVFSAYSLDCTLSAINILTGQLYLSFTGTSTYDEYMPVCSLSAPQKASRNTPASQLKFCTPTHFSGNIWRVTTDYITTFGAVPTAGDIVFVMPGIIQVSNYCLNSFQLKKFTVANF